MSHPRDRSKPHGQRSHILDLSDLKHHVDFEARTTTPNKNWSGRLPQCLPLPYRGYANRPFENTGGFDEVDDPGRRSTMSRSHREPRDGPGMTMRRTVDTDEEAVDKEMMDIVDDIGNMGIGPHRYSLSSSPQGERGVRRRHLDDHDEEDLYIYSNRPSTEEGRQGSGPGNSRMDGPMIDIPLYVPGGGRGSKAPQTANQTSLLRDLEAELDRAEEDKKQAIRESSTSRYGSAAYERCMERVEQSQSKIRETQTKIYNIDPESERLDKPARVSQHLTREAHSNHEVRGPRDSHRGPERRHGGDHGRHGAHPRISPYDNY